jgi:hypothetical protein
MSNSASRAQEINKTYTSLLLNGGVDCAPGNPRHPDLDVFGGARIRKTLCVDGDLQMSSDSNFGGDMTVNGNLNVLGDTMTNDLLVSNITADNIDTETITVNSFMFVNLTADSVTANTGCFNELKVDGNLTVFGNLTTIDTENVLVADNKILLNNSEPVAGVTAGTAGIEIDRGSLDNYLVCFDESKPGLVAGTIGNTQCVALIEDTPADGELVLYNQSTNQLESSGMTMTGNGMVGNVCGQIKTDNIVPIGSNVIVIEGNIDMDCGEISNLQALRVDQMFGKNSPINFNDTIFIKNTTEGGNIVFEDNILITSNIQTTINIGGNANAQSNKSIAIGHNALSNDNGTISIGAVSISEGNSSVALGSYSQAIGDFSVSIGGSSYKNYIVEDANPMGSGGPRATGLSSIAIGSAGIVNSGATATGEDSISIGSRSECLSDYGIAIGRNSKVESATSGISIGRGAYSYYSNDSVNVGNAARSSYSPYSISIGKSVDCSNTYYGICIGYDSTNSYSQGTLCIGYSNDVERCYQSVAIGYNITDYYSYNTVAMGRDIQIGYNRDSVVIGNNAKSGSLFGPPVEYNIAIGKNADTRDSRSIAIGYGAITDNNDGIAIGYEARSYNSYDVAIGKAARAVGQNGIAIGYDAVAYYESTAIGYSARAEVYYAVCLGSRSIADDYKTVSIGYSARARDYGTIAIGYEADSGGNYSVGVGYRALPRGLSSVAIGYRAATLVEDEIAIGTNSPNNGSAQAKCWDGQVFQDRAWADTFSNIAGIDADGNIFKTDIDVNDILVLNVDGLDMQCSNISNVNSMFVGNLFGKSPIKVHDTLAIQDTSVGGNITFEGGIEIGDYSTTTASTSTAIAIGKGASATISNSVSIGPGATITNGASGGVAIGEGATATNNAAESHVAIGRNANASGSGASECVAIGSGASATASRCTALGNDSNAVGQRSTSLGWGSSASSQAVAIGAGSAAGSEDGVAIGYNSSIPSFRNRCTAIGSGAQALNANSVSLGHGAVASAQNCLALGQGSAANSNNSIALGQNVTANQAGGFFVQHRVPGTSTGNLAVFISGTNELIESDVTPESLGGLQIVDGNLDMQCANISNTQAIFVDQMFGKNSPINFEDSLIIRDNGTDTGRITFEGDVVIESEGTQGGISIGNISSQSGIRVNQINIGNDTTTFGDQAIAIGDGAIATNGGALAIGQDATALGVSSTAVGISATASGTDSTAVGRFSSAGTNGVAVGDVARAPTNGVGVGASQQIGGDNAIQIGFQTVGVGANTVTVGLRGYNNLDGGTSVGADAECRNSTNAVSVGINAICGENAPSSISIGPNSRCQQASSMISIGSGAQCTSVQNAISIGTGATSSAVDEINIGTASPTNASSQAKCWNGQVFQDRQWSMDGNISVAGINADGNIFKTTFSVADLGMGGTTTLTNVGGNVEGNLINNGTGPSLAIKGLVAGPGVSLSATGTDITITAMGNAAPVANVDLDMNCFDITNVGNLFVGNVYGKSPINVHDTLNIVDTAAGGNITFEGAIIIGDSTTSYADSIIIGTSSSSQGSRSISIGQNNTIPNQSTNSILIGQDNDVLTFAQTSNIIAIGYNTTSFRTDSVAIGTRAYSGYFGIAVGTESSSSGKNCVSIGRNASSSNSDSISIGYNTTALANNQITIGSNSGSFSNQTICIGTGVHTLGQLNASNNIAIGNYSMRYNSTGRNNIVLGYNAHRDSTAGLYNVIIGERAAELVISQGPSRNRHNIAIGTEALSSNNISLGNYNVAIGYRAGQLTGINCRDQICIGSNSLSTSGNDGAIAIGANSTVTGQGVAIGASTTAGGGAIAIGAYITANPTTDATGTFGIAIGSRTQATATNTIAMGFAANASAQGGICMGRYSRANTQNDVAIGYRAGFFPGNGRFFTVLLGSGSGSAIGQATDGQFVDISSSRTLKKNIESLEDTHTKFDNLRPVEFEFKDDVPSDGRPKMGFIAEEVGELFPEAVFLNEEGNPKSLENTALIALNTNEIQYLKSLVNDLIARIQELEK